MSINLPGYKILETVFQSSRTTVYRATLKQDHKKVIIKTLSKEYPSFQEISRIQFEYDVLRQLDIKGVIKVYGLEKFGNKPAIVMEDFNATNLTTSQSTAISLDLFFEISIKIAKILEHIHQKNIIHKDINPYNILINPKTNEIKITDFNIATDLTNEKQNINVESQLEGSPAYISPEQTGRMNRSLDYRTDYYSLGVTFFELLTGKLPFTADDTMGFVHCHISRPIPDPQESKPDIPKSVALIIQKLMAKSAEERYQSSHGLIKDLEKCRSQLVEKGSIDVFPLGEQDVSRKFRIPQKLYGRENEVATLMSAFENVSAGHTEILLVAGHSGVGKSSLVQEIYKPITDKNGYFLSGKFDQFEQNIPYSAIIQAFKGLARQLLSRTDHQLETWKKKLEQALGMNGGLITDFIPEFEKIIGKQPPVPQLDPKDAQSRFQLLFRDFVKVFARAEHPLVIFLDDLQWSDASTIDLLMDLMKSDLGCILFLAAYRDDEIEKGLSFQFALNEIREKREKAGHPLRTLFLKPLSQETICQLIADTFHQDIETVEPLAHLIYWKTEGNPFYIVEFLTILNQSSAFEFLPDHGRWGWDLEKIKDMVVGEDVIGFLVKQIKKLPQETQDILKLASCIGHTFNLGILSLISKKSLSELADLLWKTLQQGMLIPFSDQYGMPGKDDNLDAIPENTPSYQFRHDRILQAANSLIDKNERPEIHLNIGQALLSTIRKENIEKKIFELIGYFNIGRDLIKDESGYKRLFELNRIAGKKAKDSAAFASAAEYFQQAKLLLKEGKCTIEPATLFEISKECTECLYLSGNIEESLALCDDLLDLASDKIKMSSVYILKARILDHQSKLLESLNAIRKGLQLYDIILPEDHQEIDDKIKEGIGTMQQYLAKTPIEELINLPAMKDKGYILAMNLLYEAIAPAVQTNPPLFILIELMMFDLAITHGTTEFSCKNFVDCGIIQGNILGDYQAAYAFGETAFQLIDKYQALIMKPPVYYVFGAYISQWRVHYRESLEYLNKSYRAALDVGNMQMLMYTDSTRIHHLFYIGLDLEEFNRETERTITALKNLNAYAALDSVLMFKHLTSQLSVPFEEAEARKFEDRFNTLFQSVKESNNVVNLFLFSQGKAFVSCILDELDKAKKWHKFAVQSSPGGAGVISFPDYILTQCLILTKTWQKIPKKERKQAIITLEENLDKLKIWSDNCSPNFTHKYFIVAAEIARIKGESIECVIALYSQALDAIGEGEFVHMKALINELQGRFWLEHKQEMIARMFIVEAYHLYEQWGAYNKVHLLEKKYYKWLSRSVNPSLLQPHTTSITGKSLDINSIMKSTQAISSEIKIEQLQEKLIHTMMENAGAQRGFLIWKKGISNELFIEATGENQNIQVNQSIPLKEYSNLCVDLVNYVARTHEELVLNNAQDEGDYQTNSYVREQGIKSILCLPVLHQNVLKGLLYLENNLVDHAFSSSHVSVLKMISTQAAISLENAYMYNNLDELVKQRTAQLERAQVELVENAHKVGMSDIATNILHNVGNTLNSLRTSGFKLKQSITQSIISNLIKANELLKENLHDIDNFLLKNPKGKKLLEYYLEIGEALAKENEAELDDVERLYEKIETIVTMINSQQKYVYSSNYAELLDAHEIVDSALAITANEMIRNNISIEKTYKSVPKISAQKVKLMHVLVNLIKNAEEAVLKNEKKQKKIDILIGQDEKQVFVQISDNGCGISKENLAKVFAYGFTSKKGSHGIGLHSSANYMSEMNGRLWAESEGLGKGTKMNLSFPIDGGN